MKHTSETYHLQDPRFFNPIPEPTPPSQHLFNQAPETDTQERPDVENPPAVDLSLHDNLFQLLNTAVEIAEIWNDDFAIVLRECTPKLFYFKQVAIELKLNKAPTPAEYDFFSKNMKIKFNLIVNIRQHREPNEIPTYSYLWEPSIPIYVKVKPSIPPNNEANIAEKENYIEYETFVKLVDIFFDNRHVGILPF